MFIMILHQLPIEKHASYINDHKEGNWELNVKTKELSWSPNQYKIYGFEPGEVDINSDYFLLKTTHASDVKRIAKIIDDSLKNHHEYNFKRRIVKKDGSIGYAQTQAKILREQNGQAVKIVGLTREVETMNSDGQIDYNHPEFFKIFYKNYKKAIYSKLFKMTQDAEVTQDLCQGVFVKAWNNMSTYKKEKGELYTWLINITQNHCKDYFKSLYFKSKQKTSPLDLGIEFKSVLPVAGAHLDVEGLLLHLKPEQKEIVELLFMQGFTHQEVAVIKKMPLGTVKSVSRTSINLLRKFATAQNDETLPVQSVLRVA